MFLLQGLLEDTGAVNGANNYSSTWRTIKKSVRNGEGGEGRAKTKVDKQDLEIGCQTSKSSKSDQVRDFIVGYCHSECDTVPIAVGIKGGNSVAFVVPFDKVCILFDSIDILAFLKLTSFIIFLLFRDMIFISNTYTIAK